MLGNLSNGSGTRRFFWTAAALAAFVAILPRSANAQTESGGDPCLAEGKLPYDYTGSGERDVLYAAGGYRDGNAGICAHDLAIADEREKKLKLAREAGRRARTEGTLGFVLAAAPEGRRGPEAGSAFRDCPQCPEMVVVPAGSFMMGSPPSEKYRSSDEGPRRRVTFGHAFAAGKYEVTFAEWDACASDGGCGGRRPGDQDWGRGKRPVIFVSWEDAKSYARWLSRKTGKAYRLLSEAEWEYAARAGTTGPYHTGGTIATDQANYDIGQTVPVGSFGGSDFGLHDMHGNVWEWVEDCWNGSYAGAPSDGSAWESGNCGRRILRGGSWGGDPGYLRSANRYGIVTGYRSNVAGFRVARTLAP